MNVFRIFCSVLALAVLLPTATVAQNRRKPAPPTVEKSDFRPPAVPLVTHSPYFSVWSMNDYLTDDWSRHWTGKVQPIAGLIRIDNKSYRWAGPKPNAVPAMSSTGIEIFPTRTVYHMEGGGIRLNVTFLSPLLPTNLEVLARPVTYVTWEAQAIDDKPHPVTLYFDCTGEWAVNSPDQTVNETTAKMNGLLVGKVGTEAQKILNKSGDDQRIDWGYFYVAVPQQGAKQAVIPADASRDLFGEISKAELVALHLSAPGR